MGMLTPKFFELAKKTKDTWNTWEFKEGIYGNSTHSYTSEASIKPSLYDSRTHCGSSELAYLEKSDTEKTAAIIACYYRFQQRTNLLYFAPNQKKYIKDVIEDQLVPLGFQKVLDFTHLNYLRREPDHGVSSLWILSITKEEQQKIRKIVNAQDYPD